MIKRVFVSFFYNWVWLFNVLYMIGMGWVLGWERDLYFFNSGVVVFFSFWSGSWERFVFVFVFRGFSLDFWYTFSFFVWGFFLFCLCFLFSYCLSRVGIDGGKCWVFGDDGDVVLCICGVEGWGRW